MQQMAFSLTKALVASDPDRFRRATQSTFLKHAAQGTLHKDTLGRWLANDRLYIHGYIRAAGHLLSILPLPETVSTDVEASHQHGSDPASKLLAWTVDALVNIQREERFFVETARRYGISVNLPADEEGRVASSAKSEGLRRFEALFDGLLLPRRPSEGQTGSPRLAWLESAVVFYGTEKCYLEAWTWAKSHLEPGKDGSGDEDGGAVRNEFIGNWTSGEFVEFVELLGGIIDDAVREQVAHGRAGEDALLQRGLVKWRELLAAEEAFWPTLDE